MKNKIIVPIVKIVTVPENRMIGLTNVLGELVIKLLNDNDDSVAASLKLGKYDHEDVYYTVPKAWVGKKLLIKYDQEVDNYVNNYKFYYVDENKNIKEAEKFDCGNVFISI